MNKYKPHLKISRILLILFFSFMTISLRAQDFGDRAFYESLKRFDLRGKASVTNLSLKRDRAEMTFTGDFYFAAPVNGKVAGAVFIGNGTFKADAPPISYEKEVMLRFLNSESAESDFKTAVLRFSDDTFDFIGKDGKDMEADAAPTQDAQKLATELEPRLVKETGANISARLLLSFVNQESPGVFLAQFDRGKLGRFTFLTDPQARIPCSAFSINGGEKVFLFSYAPSSFENDLWIATYSETDFDREQVRYSDEFDLVDPVHYRMEIDLRNARKILQKGNMRTEMRIDFVSRTDNLKAVPMLINNGLSEYKNVRRNNAMRVKSARYEGGDILFIQEDWESGLIFVLPKTVNAGDRFSVELVLEGDFIELSGAFMSLRSNESWYPRHGYLKRSTFNLLFRHDKNDKVASVGRLIREETWPDSKDDRLTEYDLDWPVALVAFTAGLLSRHTEKRQLEFGEVDLEFYKYTSSNFKESFVLAEFGNALEYYGKYFGPYPYDVFRGTWHPYNFGQGFPTLLLIPRADQTNREIFKFLAHETAHQWWGHIVAWRSHRDQWLSEGFAEYSGILYTGLRYNMNAQRDLIKNTRYSLPFPVNTDQGVGTVKYAEVGPLILGHRLNSRRTSGAYGIVYDKGALVLRMLHYLFSDQDTGSGQPFFDMMSDFVKQYQNKAATTEDFMRVAGEHFANSYIGKQFKLSDLNWFFQQWVFEAKLPSYRMEYRIESGDDEQFILAGTLFQENAGEQWFMPLPVVCKFGNQAGRVTVYANGPQTDFRIPLPMKPSSVELDPDLWILSEKTTTKKK